MPWYYPILLGSDGEVVNPNIEPETAAIIAEQASAVSLRKGGPVRKKGRYTLHRGEYVLSPEAVEAIDPDMFNVVKRDHRPANARYMRDYGTVPLGTLARPSGSEEDRKYMRKRGTVPLGDLGRRQR